MKGRRLRRALARANERLTLPVVMAERSLAFAAVLAVFAALTQWIVWLNRDLPEPDPFVGPPRSDYTLADFTLASFDETGKLALTVVAPRLAKHPQLDSLEIDQPRMKLRDANGEDWDARARAGWVRGDGKEVRLQGAVEVAHPPTARRGPVSVKAERLTAFVDTSMLESDTAVTIVQPGSILRGTGLEADLKQKRFTLLNQVTARYEGK